METYILFHKNDACAILDIEPETWKIGMADIIKQDLTPFNGNASESLLKKWWDQRAVPANRRMVDELVKQAGMTNNGEYLAKNLAVSVTDTYWICPLNKELTWADVCITKWENINDGKLPYHNITSYDPNASLSGQMEKYWDLSGDSPVLVKNAYKGYGQQSVNEAFASLVHSRQNNDIPYVKYFISRTHDGGIISKCKAFTSPIEELVPAYEIFEGIKTKNEESLYDSYIRICSERGINENVMQEFMDYQTLTDFIISNSDEHMNNFGILRNPDTMEFIGPAPIFDSGNSMFFGNEHIKRMERYELLNIDINSFHKKEEKMLGHIRHKDIVDFSKLPSKDETAEFYLRAGLPKERAEAIAYNYSKKVELAKDFSLGVKLSFYMEKKKYEKTSRQKNPAVKVTTPEYFIATCGIPGSGKTQTATDIVNQLKRDGFIIEDSKRLYTIEEYLNDSKILFDKESVFERLKHTGTEGTMHACIISLSSIREELKNSEIQNPDAPYTVLECRIRSAFAKGYSVVYDATNVDKKTREKYVAIANEFNVKCKKLLVLNIDREIAFEKHKNSNRNISYDVITNMQTRPNSTYPTKEEGWDEIEEHGL